MNVPRAVSPYLLAGLLGGSGGLHFLVPKPYAAIVPKLLPRPRDWVYGSGVVELACALGLAVPRTRRVSGWAAAALFVAVFPANVAMALAVGHRSAAYRAIAYGRLPLQVPLVWWATSVARAADATTPSSASSAGP